MKNKILSFLIFVALSIYQVSATAGGVCEMKNLDIRCAQGKNINLDLALIGSFTNLNLVLTIKANEALGDYLLLYINGKPEILRMISVGRPKVASAYKRAFITGSLINKIRNASSIGFKIATKKRTPLIGNLNKYHFNRIEQFALRCA